MFLSPTSAYSSIGQGEYLLADVSPTSVRGFLFLGLRLVAAFIHGVTVRLGGQECNACEFAIT